ncbi:hypothetical protein RJ639_037965 [Escallonia herrerae]|uniref:Bet v I/Major latex protein domain-containing protein n=1 Tax=Escallonia herrerae TaxID=1293975 RepID=A0AA88WR85_9ASTE|nr:hypothetical protein RJ639_037965 [Escallonia herrerae]
MHGTLSDGIEVNVPAHEAWELYGTLKITHVTHTFDKIEVVKGDGGVGTVLKLTLPAGTTVFSSYEEKHTKIDDAKMIKEAEVISGGYLDLGFILYRTRFEIVETGKTSCITKTTIEYDVNEEDVANFTYVSFLPMMSMMKDVATYLLANTKTGRPEDKICGKQFRGCGQTLLFMRLGLYRQFLTCYVLIETGTTVFSSYEEMYTKVDDEKMIKEAEVISGGYFDLGFTLYRTRFEIIETSKTSCIPKTTIEYDVNEEEVANFTYVSILPTISMMKDIATYLLENTKN